MKLLACNVGSTSLRLEAFATGSDVTLETLHRFHGSQDSAGEELQRASAYGPFDAIAHRIVHGGRFALHQAMPFDVEVEAEVRRVAYLAPDHNIPALNVVEQCRSVFGSTAMQFGVFDSAFHATMPEHVSTYPLPRDLRTGYGIRRYGFHGLSHRYSAEWVLQRVDERPLRHISIHAGNGVSAAAIVNGVSYDCSMGFTPLEGAMMGSRSGSLDPGILLEFMAGGMSAERIRQAIDRESGLLGVSGMSSNYADVAAHADTNDACRLALHMYHHRLAGEAARMAASIGGVDVLSFTGGVAEHQPQLRKDISAALGFLAIPHAFTIEAREEHVMASIVRGYVRQMHLPA